MTEDHPIADFQAIEDDLHLLEELASGCEGKIVIASFGEDPESGKKLRPRVKAFPIAHPKATYARTLAAEPNRNVYVGMSVMRPDLQEGQKGGEADVLAVLGVVLDFDAKSDQAAHLWRDRVPYPPSMVLETSSLPSPSFQLRYFFDRLVSPDVAKQIARGLVELTGCDPVSADISHVWRLAGTQNRPSKQKVEEQGRPLQPQPVRVIEPFDRSTLVDPEALLAVLKTTLGSSFPELAPMTRTANPPVLGTIDLAALDEWGVSESIKAIIRDGPDPARPKKQDNSRSAWLFQVVCELANHQVPDDKIAAIILDPRNRISESVLEKGKNALAYARRQVERAKSERDDPVLREMNEVHAIVENYGGKCIIFTFNPDGRPFHRSFEDFRSKGQAGKQVRRQGPVLPGA
jgi:hypothetical protein